MHDPGGKGGKDIHSLTIFCLKKKKSAVFSRNPAKPIESKTKNPLSPTLDS